MVNRHKKTCTEYESASATGVLFEQQLFIIAYINIYIYIYLKNHDMDRNLCGILTAWIIPLSGDCIVSLMNMDTEYNLTSSKTLSAITVCTCN